MRVGFPIFDRLGAQHRRTALYEGTRDLMFEVANIVQAHHVHAARRQSSIPSVTTETPMTAVRRLRLIDEPQTMRPRARAAPSRIAIATQDMKTLNAHFGSARNFAVYDVTPARLDACRGHQLRRRVRPEGGTHKEGKEGDDRITPKVEALEGVHLLFCLAIGGPSAAQVVRAKIHPIKMPAAQPIEAVLERTRRAC